MGVVVKTPFVVLSALFIAGSAHAATSPFDGTWKLDVSKSRFTGDTFTYSKTAAGYHASAGGAFEYDFAVDGKPHHVFADRTTTWTQAGDGGWNVLIKADGKLLRKEHTVLSPDGTKLATTSVSYRPDGTTASTSDVYARVSKSTGLVGTWKSVSVKAASDRMTISTPAPGRFKLVTGAYRETIDGKTDGSPTAVKGPDVPAGAFGLYKAVSPAKWEYSAVYKTQVIMKGTMAVSSDGRSLIETNWIPGREAESETEVYEKQ